MFYIEKLSMFYSHLEFDGFPEEVIKKTRLTLFDFLIVLLAGKIFGFNTHTICEYIAQKNENAESTFLGFKSMYSAETAALGMGMISHSVELDDGHRFGTSHPAVSVIPCVLALAEKQGSSFSDILMSIIIGYDVMLRVARSINPSHMFRGFHSTGTCGAIGSAAAAASIMGYNKEQFAFTMSLGALQSAGLQEMLHGHPSIKVLQPGKAAQAGIISAGLVGLGAKGPLSILEGQHGWLKAMTDSFDEQALIGELGERWEIMYTYTKLYPTCRHCHQVIDMAIELFNQGLSFIDIDDIELETYDVAISEVGIIRKPENFQEAMFSVSYALGVALKWGMVGITDLVRCLTDEDVLRISKKVKIKSNDYMNKQYPLERGALLRIILKDRSTIEKSVHLPKGEYETALSQKEYFQKAIVLLGEKIPEDFLSSLWHVVIDKPLDKSSYFDIKSLFDSLGVPE